MSRNPQIDIPAIVARATGRYRAVVHTGHKFDEFGNITEFGKVIRETPFSRNKITLTGFSKILQNQGGSMVMVAGSGNTTPTEGDSVLASYLGKSATVATQVTTRNSTPDVNNEIWWRTTYRITFAPSSMGGGSVNVAEAGISLNVGIGSVTSSTPICARGLLVDGGGNPTTVSVNNATEYLDIIWEYTEWFLASIAGTVTLRIDGVNTVHDYVVKPTYFDNVGGSFNFGGWQNAGSLTIPGYSPNASKSGYQNRNATHTSSAATMYPITGEYETGPAASRVPTSMATAAYVSNSKQRTFTTTWLPTEGNESPSVKLIFINLGHTHWQVSFNPPIAKINTKQLDINWTYAMANR